MAEQVTVNALRLEIVIGASFESVITWRDGAGVLVPLPLGTAARAVVRSSLYDTDELVIFDTAPGATEGLITLTDPGVTTLTMSPENTVLLQPVTDAVFDIRYEFPTGQVQVKLENGQGLCDIRVTSTR